MANDKVFDVSAQYLDQSNNAAVYYGVNVEQIMAISVKQTGPTHTVYLYLDNPELVLLRAFTNEADAITEGQLWASRINSAK